MKILHIVWGMRLGGVETMLVNIINEQVKTDAVRLFIINDFVDDTLLSKIDTRCKIKRLNREPKSKNPLKILQLNYWIFCYKPDIIHVHSYQVSKLIFGKWNIVRTIHNTKNRPDEYPRMKALYAISDVVAKFTIDQGFPNVSTIYNRIDVGAFKMKSCYKRKDETFKLIQISRLNIEQKGQHILLKALDILVNQKKITNFSMHFIGEGSSKQYLQKMVREANLEKLVLFEGLKSQEYIQKHLCDYDLFVQPSLFEGFGLTVAEAIAAKVPVLVSSIEGPMEIINAGECGMYFKVGDSEDLAEKLMVILKGEYPSSFLEKAHQRVSSLYDVKKTALAYINAYKNII